MHLPTFNWINLPHKMSLWPSSTLWYCTIKQMISHKILQFWLNGQCLQFFPCQRLSQDGSCTWHCGDTKHIVIWTNVFFQLKISSTINLTYLCILLPIIHSIKPYFVINFPSWSSSIFFLLAEIQLLDHSSRQRFHTKIKVFDYGLLISAI